MTERSTAVRGTTRSSAKQPARNKPHNGHRAGSAAPQTSHDGASPALATSESTVSEPGIADRFDQIRSDLVQRRYQLQEEHRSAITGLRTLQQVWRADASGDDQVDTGAKTLEREQELTLAHGILERIEQVERAISRIDEGIYGQCEQCENQIPMARLEAFPSATLCVTCKQRQERR